MPSSVRAVVVVSVLTVSALALRAAGPPPLPDTPKKPVTDEYHGVKVVDNYRWLDSADDPAVKKWTEAQNKHTRAILDQFPQMAALQKRHSVPSCLAGSPCSWTQRRTSASLSRPRPLDRLRPHLRYEEK